MVKKKKRLNKGKKKNSGASRRRRKAVPNLKMLSESLGIKPAAMMATIRKTTGNEVPPEGYMSMTLTRAMAEVMQPMSKLVPSVGSEVREGFSRLATSVWNYNRVADTADASLTSELIIQIKNMTGVDYSRAAEIFSHLAARKQYLVPAGIQPENMINCFVRKRDFNISGLFEKFSPDIPSFREERVAGMEIEYENICNPDPIQRRRALISVFYAFRDWCSNAENFHVYADHIFCVRVFMQFVFIECKTAEYRIEQLTKNDLNTFFGSFIFERVTMEPQDMLLFPGAVKIFFFFLHENGFLSDAAAWIEMVSSIQKMYIENLEIRYG